MISQKLLAEVFNENISTDIKIKYAEIDGVKMEWKEVWFNFKNYPLDFVAHKCKEWALDNNLLEYKILSYSENKRFVSIKYIFKNHVIEDFGIYKTDINKSLFKLCEYILDTKDL
jgi:hypothetical protein